MFGSHYIVGEAFIQTLHNWQKIAKNDVVNPRNFSGYLTNVKVIKKPKKLLAVLDFEHENFAIF